MCPQQVCIALAILHALLIACFGTQYKTCFLDIKIIQLLG